MDTNRSFTLVISNFGVKYINQWNAEHLKTALEALYKYTTDNRLLWKIVHGYYAQLELPKIYCAAINDGVCGGSPTQIPRGKPIQMQDSQYLRIAPVYVSDNHNVAPNDDSPLLPEEQQAEILSIIGTLLYYG